MTELGEGPWSSVLASCSEDVFIGGQPCAASATAEAAMPDPHHYSVNRSHFSREEEFSALPSKNKVIIEITAGSKLATLKHPNKHFAPSCFIRALTRI